jgi:hypothetical protein
MSEMTHECARKLLHEGRSRLRAPQRAELDGHLASCRECQGYAAHLAAMEPALTRAMRADWDTVNLPANPNFGQRHMPLAKQQRPRIAAIILAGGLTLLAVFALSASGWLQRLVSFGPLASTQPYAVYLSDFWTTPQFVPLDPSTLADRAGVVTPPRHGSLYSADGSTLVDVEYAAGFNATSAGSQPNLIWIVVRDLSSGAERARFHPPVGGDPLALSADGTRLLLQPNQTASRAFIDLYLLSTTDGRLLSHIQDSHHACWRQISTFDAALLRAYCLSDQFGNAQPAHLLAYDLSTGALASQLDLVDVLVGPPSAGSAAGGSPIFFEPSLALSPDGGQIALVHADTDRVTLVDAQALTLERSLPLSPQASLWDFLAPAIAYAKGGPSTLRQAVYGSDGRILYVFTQVVSDTPPAQRGLWAVDLTTGTILARALTELQVQWVIPAPDGSVYVYGTTDPDLVEFEIRPSSPSSLWRLAAATLKPLAHRDFTGYRDGRLVLQSPSHAP